LRITISYLDTTANANSLLPLLADLDLIVLSKPGNVVHGNHYLNGSEEHFLTRERAILNPDEIEMGSCEIVTSSFSEVVEIATFSLVLSRKISPDQSDCIFTRAPSCVPCARTCDSETPIGKCESLTLIGQSCQIASQIVSASQDPVIRLFTVPALESLSVTLMRPSKSKNFAVHVSGYSAIFLQMVIAGDKSPNQVPFKYQTPF
jgi:hypothetical protein